MKLPAAMTTLRRRLADPKRRFWLIAGLITLGGAILRALIHDFGLPWFDNVDELNLWYFGLRARDIPSPFGDGSVGVTKFYPPLIFWLHQVAQPLAEAQGRLLPGDAVLILRRVVLVFNVLGGIWFAMLGRRCGGAPAGIIAAALWAFEPRLLSELVVVISEAIVYPLLILSLLLAVHALEAPRRWWPALVSMAVGALCFLGEYRLLVAVIPGLAALLWLAWRRFRPGRRPALLWGIAGLAIAAGGGALILARLPASMQEIARETLTTHAWDFEALFRWLGKTVILIHPALLLLFLAPVLLTLRWRPVGRAAPRSTPALRVVGATMVLTMWAVIAFRAYGEESLAKIWQRYQLPTLLMLYLLLGTAVAQLLPRVQVRRVRNLVAGLFVTSLLLFHLLPSLQLVREYRLPPWPLFVRSWLDDNLEASTILIYPVSYRWIDPARSGLPYRVWFNTRTIEGLRGIPLEERINKNLASWALIPTSAHDALRGDEEGRAVLEQMLLMREFRAPPERRHDETLLYRLWRMQHESDVRFGEHIRLTGYDLHTPDPLPGQTLDLTLYWNAAATPPENYSFFLQLVADDDPRPLAGVDGNPAVPLRPTRTWDRPEETLISPRFSLSLPENLAPGDYRVMLGLYNPETDARLPARDAQGVSPGDAWELTQVRIAAP